MEQKRQENQIGTTGWVTAGFASASAILRPLPTLLLLPFNFSPVGGLALFGGARVRTWLAYLLPISVMVVTDLALWAIKGELYSPLHISRPLVYGSFLIYVLLGRTLIGTGNPLRIGVTALLGSAQFFLLTNLGAWLELDFLYERSLSGLLNCYAAGLPFQNTETVTSTIGFFGFTVLGDLLFAGLFFGLDSVVVHAAQPEPALDSVSIEG
ncbi:MAG: hypothetical protein HY040_12535 [Planctomycetes bacterium]|nr:hypothetical protein [Planctomycetota bacterium]